MSCFMVIINSYREARKYRPHDHQSMKKKVLENNNIIVLLYRRQT